MIIYYHIFRGERKEDTERLSFQNEAEIEGTRGHVSRCGFSCDFLLVYSVAN